MSIEDGERKDELQELEDNPEHNKILQEESLKYLKEKESQWFYSEYSGEVDDEGYLLDKNGSKTGFLPSHCIGAGGYAEVVRATQERIGQ